MFKNRKLRIEIIIVVVLLFAVFLYLHFINTIGISDTEFYENSDKMKEIVQMAQNGELKVIDSYDEPELQADTMILKLPFKYYNLSQGGKIYFNDNNGVISVVFVSGFDMFREHAFGYLYRNDNQIVTDRIGITKSISVQIEPNWFRSY